MNLAALRGDAALYDRYLKASKAATQPEVRYQYLYGLTAFSDPALVRRTMDLTLSDEVRSQDAKLVIGRMLVNADTQTLAWQLVRERWNEIQKKTGEFVGNTVIVGALSSFCDAVDGRRDQGVLHGHTRCPTPSARCSSRWSGSTPARGAPPPRRRSWRNG